MPSTQRLLIMTKTPIPGTVKTRLAASVGNNLACDIYKYLLAHTAQLAEQVSVDRRVFYAPEIVPNDAFDQVKFSKTLQVAGDLGAKMRAAFEEAFEAGMTRVVIIGSDCYELTSGQLQEAFEALRSSDVVLGPAHDGGYYLLGLSQMIPQVFEDKPWSQPELYTETVAQLQELGFQCTTLPPLSDVDYLEDLPESVRIRFGLH